MLPSSLRKTGSGPVGRPGGEIASRSQARSVPSPPRASAIRPSKLNQPSPMEASCPRSVILGGVGASVRRFQISTTWLVAVLYVLTVISDEPSAEKAFTKPALGNVAFPILGSALPTGQSSTSGLAGALP